MLFCELFVFTYVTDARSCHDQGFVGVWFHGKPIIFYVLLLKYEKEWALEKSCKYPYKLWNNSMEFLLLKA